MKSKRLLVSLVVAIAVILLFGTMSSYAATEITASSNSSSPVQITPSTNTANRTVTTGNTSVINSTVNTHTNATSSATANVNKTPVANSSSSKIPYAGTGSIAGAFIVVVILLGSSIFAYKKVSEYNV